MQITARAHDDEVRRLMERVAARYGNLRPVWRDVGEEYTRRVDDRFVSQTDPDGNRWLPTKVISSYLGYVGTAKGATRRSAYTKDGRWRAAFSRYLENKKTLQLTGALRGDIHYQYDASSVIIGTSGRVPYAGIHQFGGMAGRGRKVRIPARPYLARNVGDGMEVSPRDRDMVILRIAAYLQN